MRLYGILFVIVAVSVPSTAVFAGVTGTPHDFSPGRTGSMACQYCHTPHMAMTGTPLWNHKLSERVYEIYWSSSLDAKVGQPTGSSKLCLSCHDGTVALEATVRGGAGSTFIKPGAKNLGTDLSDDHPVSFVYSSDVSDKDPQIRPPEGVVDELKLDHLGEMQCTTCHDPHDNSFGNFLVMTNIRSNMCVQCHMITGWTGSVHAGAVADVKDAADDYLTGTGYATVQDNGCLSCHQVHSAAGKQRLFHFAEEEKNCLSCHNGLVANTNLTAAFEKISGHFVQDYTGEHDIREEADSSQQHVECVDCHNPHAMSQSIAQAPNVVGALKGVSGVTAQGSVIESANYEYEICYKCHGNNPNRIDSEISRVITQTNVLMEFDQANPSYHPVTVQGINRNVPSLLAGMDESTVIYCTDCHNSDSSSQVKGPHGSDNPYLLASRYETADETQESPEAYALCYKCHDRESILNDESFDAHNKHIREENTPCSVCHDAHGISSVQGTSLNNTNLINFDSSVVFADPDTDRLEFEDLGTFRGRCYLECHGEKHSPEEYRLDSHD
jgi:predicted CXXCH cytochrome family protein